MTHFPDKSVRLSAKPPDFAQALDIQADIIATACPTCMRTLQQAAESLRIAGTIVVQDVAELLLQSIEKSYEHPLPIHVNLELEQEVLHA